MRVLVVGSGGREHALIRAIARTSPNSELFSFPGNAGILTEANFFGVRSSEHRDWVQAAVEKHIDLVVIGPEAPLVEGLADSFRAAGIACFGPSAAAAQLEGSKVFAKDMMIKSKIPTAQHRVVTSVADGLAAITDYPIVIKADGLAAGKGVTIAEDQAHAQLALTELLVEKRFGETRVVVEEFLEGEELSVLALCDGKNAIPLQPARDYKRLATGDSGPNTGGMGAFSPVQAIDKDLIDEICATVHQPLIDQMANSGKPFLGVLYAGLMLTEQGPKVLEFNVRFGDPETQVILPRIKIDLAELLYAATKPGGLSGVKLEWDERSAVTVVLASSGYPENPKLGDLITGRLETRTTEEAEINITHAGTAWEKPNELTSTTSNTSLPESNNLPQSKNLVTAGGRVLNVTALASNLAPATKAVYEAVDEIHFSGMQYRTDIAQPK